jgi:TP901 family phage tail tape measure protein
MAGENEIILSIEAQQVNSTTSGMTRGIADFVKAGNTAQRTINDITTAYDRLNKALVALGDDKNSKFISQINQALAGNFSEAQLKLSAVKGQLKELQTQASQVISSIANAQSRAYSNIAKAVQEQQVQAFQKNQNFAYVFDQDPNSLKLRIQAEQRAINESVVQGGAPSADAVARLKRIEDQLKKVTAAREMDLAVQEKGNAAYRLTPTVVGPSQSLSQSPENQQARAQSANANTLARFNLNGGADFIKVQGTILANYALMNAAFSTLRNSFNFVVDYQTALKQLQAIVGATDEEVAGLSQRFVEVSNNSKFSASEIAQAATVMGQAGLSSDQIKDTIADVIKLATATGTDLKTAVDLATTAMNVFNVRSQEMGNFSNIVSASLNESKLDAEKLSTALQYVGNVAADSGVSFSEVATGLAAMSNAGIKSGSTLGTGLRQIIEAMVNPSTKFKETLASLGLTMSDVDIQSEGLFGALRNLRDAGFTAADGLRDFGVRGGGAIASLINEAGDLTTLQHTLETTGDAAKANATQMDTVEAQAKRVASAAGALAVSVSGPLLTALKDALNVFADLLGDLQGFNGVLGVVTTTIAGVAAVAVAKWVAGLAAGLLGIKSFGAGLTSLTTAFSEATTVGEGFMAVVGTLGKANIFIALASAVLVVAQNFNLFQSNAAALQEQMDKLQTSFNETKGRVDNYQTAITAIGGEIENLTNRHDRLASHSDELGNVIEDLNKKFRDLGFYVDASSTSVDTLISKMEGLRQAQLNEMAVANTQQQSLLKSQIDTAQQQTNGLFGPNGNNAFLGRAGVFKQVNYAQVNGVPDATTNALQSAADLFNGPAPQTDQEISAFNAKLAAKTKELTDLQEKLRASLGDASTQARNDITAVLTALSDASKKINDKVGLESKLTSIGGQGNAITAATSPLGQDLQKLRDSISTQLSGIEGKYNGAGGNANEQAQRQHAANLAQLYQDASNQYAAVLSFVDGKTLSDLKNAGVTGDVDKTLADIKQRAQSSGIDVNKLDEIQLNAQKKAVEARIAQLNSQVNNKTPIDTIEAIPDQLDTAYTQLAFIQKQLNGIKQKNTPVNGPNDSTVQAGLDEVQAIMDRNKQDTDKVHSYLDEANKAVAEVGDRVGNDMTRQLKQFSAGIKAINDNFKNANDAIKQPLKDQQALVAGMKLQFNGNANKYSDVQVTQEKNKQEALQAEQDYALRDELNKQIALITQQQAAIAETIAKLEVSKVSDRAAALDTNSTQDDRTRADARFKKDQTDQTSALGQQATLQKQLADLDQQRSDLNEKITNEYESQLEPLSISKGFMEALNQYGQETGNLKTQNAKLIDSFKGLFSSIQSSMSTFVQDITSGNKSVGQSFKDLATSILQSMAKLAADQFASQLFKLGMSALLSLGTSSAGPTGASNDAGVGDFSGGGVQTARMGGQVLRRAGGGGIPTRDSVNVLAMPGEFMVQKSAVDAVGTDFMDKLNSISHGGKVPTLSNPMMAANQNQTKGEPTVINVWMIPQTQVPVPGPKDIVAHVADDMAKGGVTKRLVKQIVTGG